MFSWTAPRLPKIIDSAALVLCLIAAASLARAATQSVVDYEYDGAGNIVRIVSGRNSGVPDVTALQPAFIHKESSTPVMATGVNLFNATVATTTPGLTITDVTNVSETEMRLTLSADASAVVGPGVLTFTSVLGSDDETIAIADRTPVVSTQPNPIVLAPGGHGVAVKMVFDEPFDTDQTYSIGMRNAMIASVSEQNVTLPAGTTEASVTVAGLNAGQTQLEITDLSDFLALGIPVIVADARLPTGPHAVYAEPVGVAVYLRPASQTTGVSVAARPVGVATFLEPPAQTASVFALSRPLGIVTFTEPPSQTTGIIAVSRPLGVTVELEP